jgi:hypothetical protein
MDSDQIVESLLATARRWREEADELAVARDGKAAAQAESRRRAAAYAEESAARIARAA